MSYTEQANKINDELKVILKNIPEATKKDIINKILQFGQVAKFRCRSNIAYDNFSKEVFKDIVEIERAKPEYLDFEILRVKEVEK